MYIVHYTSTVVPIAKMTWLTGCDCFQCINNLSQIFIKTYTGKQQQLAKAYNSRTTNNLRHSNNCPMEITYKEFQLFII